MFCSQFTEDYGILLVRYWCNFLAMLATVSLDCRFIDSPQSWYSRQAVRDTLEDCYDLVKISAKLVSNKIMNMFKTVMTTLVPLSHAIDIRA